MDFTLGNGHFFNMAEPSPTLIMMYRHTIARALGRICRYNGHLPEDIDHYSVAEHCVRGCELVPSELRLEFLAHDFAEACGIGDIITPYKRVIGPVAQGVETEIEKTIAQAFKLDTSPEARQVVKAADHAMWVTEEAVIRRAPVSKYGPGFARDEKAFVPGMVFDCWPASVASKQYSVLLDTLLRERKVL